MTDNRIRYILSHTEAGASPTNNIFSLRTGHWSQSTSETDWRFGNIPFPVRVRADRSNPRPNPPGLPHVHREASPNMAEQSGPGNQALGNGRGSPPDGWICSNTRTKDLKARSSNAEEEEEEDAFYKYKLSCILF